MWKIALNQAFLAQAIFVIDASAIMFRSFYGLAPLRTSKGFPTQAVVGFFKTLQKLINKFAPEQFIICWDSKQNFRRELFADYKANRQHFPDELAVQRQKIIEILTAMKLLQLEVSGFEADDLIFTLSQQLSPAPVVIVSSDKDLLQLVDDARVLQYDPAKDLLFDVAQVTAYFGFAPNKIAFYHALLGDASDNIPGAKGIGKKTAAELVLQFAHLEELYNNLAKLPARTAKLLEASKADVELSAKLFALQSAPIDFEPCQGKIPTDAWQRPQAIFLELEMKSFVDKNSSKQPSQKSLFAKADQASGAPALEQKPYLWLEYEIVDQFAKLDQICAGAQKTGLLALDLETTGLDWQTSQIVGLSLAFEPNKSFYVPINHQNLTWPQLPLTKVLERLRPVLAEPKILKVLQNAKFDLHFLAAHNVGISSKQLFDTMLAARLVRPEWQRADLSTLANDYLDYHLPDFKELFCDVTNFSYAALELAAPYAAADALCTLKLQPILAQKLQEQNLTELFFKLEMPLVNVILAMEAHGIVVDLAVLKQLNLRLEQELLNVETKVRASLEALNAPSAQSLNLLSPKQVEQVLFEELKLPAVTKRKGGSRATDKDALEELAKIHPVPNLILSYRRLAKLQNTYLEALPKQIHPSSGKVHTTFLQGRVSTGRLSSVEPNLQNVPTLVRSAFVPDAGKLFFAADYSQIELRILAHLSQDEVLVKAFLAGQDVHSQTAAQIFAVSSEVVTPEQRQIGKRINFSVLYGLSAFSLARELSLPRSVAQQYIDAFFAKYQGVRSWMDELIKTTTATGFTQTLLGRRRYFPDIADRNQTVSNAAQRAAINSVVQGSAAEIIKLAMVKIQATLEQQPALGKMILQVHDELLLETDAENLAELKALVSSTMQQVMVLAVPLEVSCKFGANWGQLQKMAL